MGKLLVFSKYVIFVFSGDINEKRKHIHIRDKKGRINRLCKFWIQPEIELANNHGFSKSEIAEIKKLVTSNIEIIKIQLKAFHAGKKVKSIIVS